MDRYILSECWLPFIAGCGIVTGVWLGADQIRDVFQILSRSNVGLLVIFPIILLSMPTILFTTVPIGTFLASFLVFNRLSSDSELIALRAGGVSLFRIVLPTMFFGCIMAAFTFVLGDVVIPWSQPTVAKIQSAALQKASITSKRDFAYFERSGGKHIGQGALQRIFYVKDIDLETSNLNDVIVIDFTSLGTRQVLFSKEGRWNSEKGGWELGQTITYKVSLEDPSSPNHIAKFDKFIIPSNKSIKDIQNKIHKLRHLNIAELWQTIQEHKKFTKDTNIETESIYKLMVKFHEKFSYPLSCIILAFVGAPLGIMARRSRTNWGYAQVGVLMFLYFASQSSVGSLGDTGHIDPFFAAWIPNIILALIGVIILWNKSRLSSS